jgi:hypothetical protein
MGANRLIWTILRIGSPEISPRTTIIDRFSFIFAKNARYLMKNKGRTKLMSTVCVYLSLYGMRRDECWIVQANGNWINAGYGQLL